MCRSRAVVAAVLFGLGLVVAPATATANAPPLPDAGLDQTVDAGATVHLNANGSRDPDGSIAGVRWTIEAPSGATTSPDCPTCRQTQFDPGGTGQYTVTLTVTDDDGAARSDTLYVDVQTDAGPTVSLSGPNTAVWNRSTTLTADIQRGDADLSTVAWAVDGEFVHRSSLADDATRATFEYAYTGSGSVSVRAVVYDSAGHRATAAHSLTVLTGGGDGGNGGNATSGDDECHFWNHDCLNDEVLVNPATGQERVVEANGDEGIQVNTANGRVNVRDELSDGELAEYRLPNGGLDADVIDRVKTEVKMDRAVEDTSTDKSDTKNDDDGNDSLDHPDNGGDGGDPIESSGDPVYSGSDDDAGFPYP